MKSKLPDITNLATKVALNIKSTEIVDKILNTTGFTVTPEFNRLSKISFDARIKKAVKILASKSQANDALDIASRQEREKTKKTLGV